MMIIHLAIFCIAISSVFAADDAALVTSLPGLNYKPKFRQYSGFLEVTANHRLHYWFVESQNNPTTDPLVLWLNGGPGCSSLDGLLTENGPFRVQKNGTLTDNPYAWNKRASVIYLEAPAGVGFSYATDGNVTTNDDQTSQQNYNALLMFFAKFPEYKTNDFYITGESYGGIYIPTLTMRVIAAGQKINLKGIAVGNGLSSYRYNDVSLIYFAYYHGLFHDDVWNALQTHCNCTGEERCFFTDNKSAGCKLAVDTAQLSLDGYNIYNLYGPCYHSDDQNTMNTRYFNNLFRSNPYVARRQKKIMKLRKAGIVVDDPPCIDGSAATEYLNMPSVRSALHIPPSIHKWALCSADVESNYHRNYQDMFAQYRAIMQTNLRILIYNGDIDMACNFLGDEWFFDDLKYKNDYSGKQWYITTDAGIQVGGVSKSYSAGQLLFTTVRGAGHMVPTDRALSAFHMINSFLTNKSL